MSSLCGDATNQLRDVTNQQFVLALLRVVGNLTRNMTLNLQNLIVKLDMYGRHM